MDSIIDWLIAFASDRDHPLGLATMFGSAAIEYVFPPFPGDTITLLGAILITGYGWSWWLVGGAVMLGSLLGAFADYWVGCRLRHRQHKPAHAARWAAIGRVVARFERHGPAYLVLNRFVPGLRPLFFVAAGLAGMRKRDVFLYGGLSVALWVGALIALGAALGANLESMQVWVKRYSRAAWIAVASALLLYMIVRIVRRWRRGRAGPPADA